MRIARVLLKRIVGAVPLLVVLLFLTVLLQDITPGDPAQAIAGPRASEEVVEAIRAQYHLNDPLWTQFTTALGRVVQGDLGVSSRVGAPVAFLIAERAPQTAWLAGAGLAVSMVFALIVGVWAGSGRRWARTLIDQLSLASMNLPTYWLSLVLVLLFALQLGWFPVGGIGDGLWDRLYHLVLPTAVVAAAIAPVLARSLAESSARVMQSDHVVTARAAGLSRPRIVRRHVVRNALPPMVTLLGLQAGYIVFGLVMVEMSFGINGLGSMLFQAVSDRDFPVVQGLTLVLGMCVVFANMIADVIVAALDPRWTL